MGTRLNIPLQPCLNPGHSDSTPSMAVYDHGKDKLQVFCFGCGYHAWVTMDEIGVSSCKKKVEPPLCVVKEVDHTELVTKFFLDRNFKKEDIPWGAITMGNELREYSNYPESRSYDVYTRPFMEWKLYDYKWNVAGSQRRYLDTGKPKTKYFHGPNGEYADICWKCISSINKTLHITESWVDANWIFKRVVCPSDTMAEQDIVTILGTNSNKVKLYIYDWSKQYDEIHLWFDGDDPGIKCSRELGRQVSQYGIPWISHTRLDKKVYELEVD